MNVCDMQFFFLLFVDLLEKKYKTFSCILAQRV